MLTLVWFETGGCTEQLKPKFKFKPFYRIWLVKIEIIKQKTNYNLSVRNEI